MLNGSEADTRHEEILDILEQRHPESLELLNELSDLFGDLWNEAEDEGAVRQAALIRAALDGTVTFPTGADGEIQGRVRL